MPSPLPNSAPLDPVRNLVGGTTHSPVPPALFDDAESVRDLPDYRTVAALYVSTRGSYIDLSGVDAWGEARDARRYNGPYPVVAHPPCQRWGKLWAGQPLWIKRTGQRKIKGDDGGCFAAALNAARTYGGVIEHPWQSHAWPHFGIYVPPRSGGWIEADEYGWTCCVEQGRYGHYARKPTLLYVCGVAYEDLPELDWGIGERQLDPAVVARMGLKRAIKLGEVGGKGGGKDSAPRIGTPAPFRDLLLSIARTAKPLHHELSQPADSHCGAFAGDGVGPIHSETSSPEAQRNHG